MAQDKIFLLPGEYQVTRRPATLATLLGSCVAVCLRNRTTGHGAMNHFLLPEAPPNPAKDKGHYGDLSTGAILELMGKLGGGLRDVAARVYGGAAVVGHLSAGEGIGKRNVEVAKEVLKKRGVRIMEEDTGGQQGRRIYFDTAAGTVTVKQVQKSKETSDLARKRADIASRNTRVLVVDDSPLVRKILTRAIDSTNGMEVCGQAGDAFEARDLILSEDPDVISLDIIMPKLDGLKFLKKLSTHFPKSVVICSTIAKDGSQVVERARQLGAMEVVDKDSLELYRGMDVVKQELIPKLRRAAGRVARKIAT